MNAVSRRPFRGSLPIGATAARAWRVVWQSRDEILRIGAIPLLLTFGLSLAVKAWHNPAIVVAGLVLDWVPFTLFAVAWLRTLLRSGDANARSLTTRWSDRETKFLLRALTINFGTNVTAGIAVGVIALVLGTRLDDPGGSFFLLVAAAAGAAVYVMLRLSLVLPAIAIDLAYGYRDSWGDTAGRGIQLLLIVMLTDLPAGVALVLLNWTRLAQGLPYTFLLVTDALGYVVFAASMTVLALAFRACAGTPGQPLSVIER